MSKFIKFVKIEEKPKTNVYAIVALNPKGVGIRLGIVKWHSGWRKYCFFPEGGMLFDVVCMHFIIGFIENLTEERKKGWMCTNK